MIKMLVRESVQAIVAISLDSRAEVLCVHETGVGYTGRAPVLAGS